MTPTDTTYHHHDALGSTVALNTTTGAVAERYSYDVYGAPTIKAPNGQIRNSSSYGIRFFFTGRECIQQALIFDYREPMYSGGGPECQMSETHRLIPFLRFDDANQLLSETEQIAADGGPKSVSSPTYTLDGQRMKRNSASAL